MRTTRTFFLNTFLQIPRCVCEDIEELRSAIAELAACEARGIIWNVRFYFSNLTSDF
jgi:hypothetical protein